MRAMNDLWNQICTKRYGVKDKKFKRLRYGVQVNSLGLTEQQPENNVYRILIEMLAVVLSKDARARAVQLPAWNEALGLPRQWDQQWSIRLQQIVGQETDLLNYEDIFNGSKTIDKKVKELIAKVNKELKIIDKMGGAVISVENSYMKQNLVKSMSERVSAIESGEQVVVGVNKFTETAESPLTVDNKGFMKLDIKSESEQIKKLKIWRKKRNEKKCQYFLKKLKSDAMEGKNIMQSSIECAHAGVTTGEWAGILREVYGEYRAPTGVGKSIMKHSDLSFRKINSRVNKLSSKLNRRIKLLIGKPGLDGHSSGAEQIAVASRDIGMEVVYEGIRLTPQQIVNTAIEESVHMIALSILSGSHLSLTSEVIKLMKKNNLSLPLIVGGIIPPEDEKKLLKLGVSRIYTPKNYDIKSIMDDFVSILEKFY